MDCGMCKYYEDLIVLHERFLQYIKDGLIIGENAKFIESRLVTLKLELKMHSILHDM